MIAPVKIPSDSELVNDFNEAKTIICRNLSLKNPPHEISSNNYSYFKKYYSELIRQAIRADDYPLDCRLIREVYLLNSQIDNRGKQLGKIEKKFGEEYLNTLMHEWPNIYGSNLSRGLYVMASECLCAELISKIPEVHSINKITNNGDLQFFIKDQEWHIEVKRAFDEYTNLRLVADAIAGALFLKENRIFRELDYIKLGGEEINDSFLNKVIKFIHDNNFRNVLNSSCKTKKGDFKGIVYEMERDFFEQNNQVLRFSDDDLEVGIRRKVELTIHTGCNASIFLKFKVRKIKLHRDKLLEKIKWKINSIKKKFDPINHINQAGFIELDLYPYIEDEVGEFRPYIKQFLEKNIYNIPCIIFLNGWFLGGEPIIMNKVAEDLSFSRMIKN